MRRVTLDSNIYISAFVFGGKPLQLLEMAIDGEIAVAISDAIVEEVVGVLEAKFGWSRTRANEARQTIRAFADRVVPAESLDVIQVDPDDNRVVECAVAAGSDAIITGDADLLALGSFRGIAVVRAADFLNRFR